MVCAAALAIATLTCTLAHRLSSLSGPMVSHLYAFAPAVPVLHMVGRAQASSASDTPSHSNQPRCRISQATSP